MKRFLTTSDNDYPPQTAHDYMTYLPAENKWLKSLTESFEIDDLGDLCNQICRMVSPTSDSLEHVLEAYKSRNLLHPCVRQLFKHIVLKQRTESWFRFRRTRVTASQLCSAVNSKLYSEKYIHRFRSKFRTRNQLLRSKMGTLHTKDNFALQHGRKNESIAIAKAIAAGCPILHHVDENGVVDAIDFGILQHPKYGFLAGSPDGISADGCIVEVKCPWSVRKQTSLKAGYVPDEYLMQLQILMDITNLDGAYFIQYAPESLFIEETLAITFVPRMKSFFNECMLPAAKEFYTRMMTEMKKSPLNSPSAEEKKQMEAKQRKAEQRKIKRDNKAKEALQFYYTLAEGNQILTSHADMNSRIERIRLVRSGAVQAADDESDEDTIGVL